MPVIMPIILVGVPGGLRLGGIVHATVVAGLLVGTRAVRGQNRAPLLQVQVHIALQTNRKAKIRPRREQHHPTAHCGCRFNRMIHRTRIQRLAVARSTEFTHIEDALRRHSSTRTNGCLSGKRGRWNCRCRHAQATCAQEISAQITKCCH